MYMSDFIVSPSGPIVQWARYARCLRFIDPWSTIWPSGRNSVWKRLSRRCNGREAIKCWTIWDRLSWSHAISGCRYKDYKLALLAIFAAISDHWWYDKQNTQHKAIPDRWPIVKLNNASNDRRSTMYSTCSDRCAIGKLNVVSSDLRSMN